MSNAELERNKAVALRFKKSQGTPAMPQVEKEVLAPNYNRIRGGNFHLASNARDQNWPGPGMYLRSAFPDRVDVIEQVIADGDRVGLLFRLTATHTGNLFGIPPTGRKVDVYEIAILRIVDGQMVEGWFMMDEAELLRQLGAKMPLRSDGKIIAPPPPAAGEEPDALVARLKAAPPASPQDRNKIIVAGSRSRAPTPESCPADLRHVRYGFQHLRDYASAHGLEAQTLSSAIPQRHDRIEVLLAEGDSVWMRFNTNGIQRGSLCGIAPTNQPVGVSVVATASFNNGKWRESWYFADELGLLLQLGKPNLLLDV